MLSGVIVPVDGSSTYTWQRSPSDDPGFRETKAISRPSRLSAAGLIVRIWSSRIRWVRGEVTGTVEHAIWRSNHRTAPECNESHCGADSQH